jgi:hypothetical protein
LLTCVGSYIWITAKNEDHEKLFFFDVSYFPELPRFRYFQHRQVVIVNIIFIFHDHTRLKCASHNGKRKSLQNIQKVIQRKHNLWFIWNDIFFTDYGFGFSCFS